MRTNGLFDRVYYDVNIMNKSYKQKKKKQKKKRRWWRWRRWWRRRRTTMNKNNPLDSKLGVW